MENDSKTHDIRELDPVRETLFSWQDTSEGDLFVVLNKKRRQEPINEDERDYLFYYNNTFATEIASTLLTIPLGYYGMKFRMENKKPLKDAQKLNTYMRGIFIIGIPALNLFTYSFYRRNFGTPENENRLKLKYGKHIRDLVMERSKPVKPNTSAASTKIPITPIQSKDQELSTPSSAKPTDRA